jgi:signal transduction histidine kinase
MGGSIRVVSQPGQGAEFAFEVPLEIEVSASGKQ